VCLEVCPEMAEHHGKPEDELLEKMYASHHQSD
jgi:hypothetical protein